MRRLLVVEFKRVIPYEEQIEEIGKLILMEEMDLVLSWAVEGAKRLVRRRMFAVPPSSQRALMEWAQSADPVQGWLAARVVQEPGRKMESSAAYADFAKWCKTAGYRPEAIPAINAFSQRLQAAGLPLRKSGLFRGFYGVRVRSMEEDIEDAREWGRGTVVFGANTGSVRTVGPAV